MNEETTDVLNGLRFALDYHRRWIFSVDQRLSMLERRFDSHEEAIVDSLCELSDRVAPLEGRRHG